MGVLSIRMPDIGEGIAEAELVEWMVAPGDTIAEDAPMAAVMTDKATVEIPAPASGKVLWLGGAVGETLAVGSDLIHLEVDGPGNMVEGAPPPAPTPAPEPTPIGGAAPAPFLKVATPRPTGPLLPRPEGEKPLAPPSVRARARELGLDLRRVRGTGPAGRITHDDLEAALAAGSEAPGTSAPTGRVRREDVEDIPVVGLRRKIADRMVEAKRRIPHFTIVEEVDVTALEDLRAALNAEGGEGAVKLTVLPLLGRALVRTLADFPGLNAHYDDQAGVVRRFGAVHLGIATQTPGGLMVPVIAHAESLGVRGMAAELARVARAAREGAARREALSGSTITISSLGPLGAIATTPIINRPEVAIVGVNRMAMRPHWNGTAFVPRKMMNLSCGFDHRVVDGWDAALFVQRLKHLLENPALIFVEQD
jgi:2-oxoisovalerate dehydrogenase E2 component (dihydrolipoyl transacylase)